MTFQRVSNNNQLPTVMQQEQSTAIDIQAGKVKAHTRRSKTGKVVQVKESFRKDFAKAQTQRKVLLKKYKAARGANRELLRKKINTLGRKIRTLRGKVTRQASLQKRGLTKESAAKLSQQNKKQMVADKKKVYEAITSLGPDVDMYSAAFSRLVGRIRKHYKGKLPNKQKLIKTLDSMGYGGSKSDQLRNDGDKYF